MKNKITMIFMTGALALGLSIAPGLNLTDSAPAEAATKCTVVRVPPTKPAWLCALASDPRGQTDPACSWRSKQVCKVVK